MKKLNNISGLTLIELIIATSILLLVFTIVSSSVANFTSSKRRILLSSEVYNETRFLLERIVKEVRNGTIDYQGYWKESLLNRTARFWVHETGEAVSEMGSEISSADDNFSNQTINGLNSYINCGYPDLDSDSSNTYTIGAKQYSKSHFKDTEESNTPYQKDTLDKRKDVLYNYRYQFIYPGSTFVAGGNTQTSGEIHLNCLTDDFNDDDLSGTYNIYDDESSYGTGPRALSEVSSTYPANLNASDLEKNHALSSQILWSWDFPTETPLTNNNPPLLLVKSDENEEIYTRTALRLEDKRIKLIKFQSGDTSNGVSIYDADTPPDNIPDRWMCMKDFLCDNKRNGTYIWSQKSAERQNNTFAAGISGTSNGVNTIADSNLTWKDITPEKIEIISFEFLISPVKDPHRAFYEKDRIQKPQVTIIIEARAKESAMKGIKGESPTIKLQTTATPRIWSLVNIDS